jgi:hypothetical protein
LKEAISVRLRGRIALADIQSVFVLDYDSLSAHSPSLGIECK